jgi:hypothetical protein
MNATKDQLCCLAAGQTQKEGCPARTPSSQRTLRGKTWLISISTFLLQQIMQNILAAWMGPVRFIQRINRGIFPIGRQNWHPLRAGLLVGPARKTSAAGLGLARSRQRAPGNGPQAMGPRQWAPGNGPQAMGLVGSVRWFPMRSED